MRVMLIGGGGREAALAWRLARSQTLTELVVTHQNPGWPDRASVRLAGDVAEQVALAQAMSADLVVVGPEGPLSKGIADRLSEVGISCFGPTQAAAQLETSKAFCKEVCEAAGVPTAGALVVSRDDEAQWAKALDRCALGRVVIKADGLASGKGVIVCRSGKEAVAALEEIQRFGSAAKRILLEDLLEGPEVSLFALCDGERIAMLPSSQDHKRLETGDLGPNTGGMGAVAPCSLIPEEEGEALGRDLILPVVAELARRGTPFRGVLYAGLMITADGPKVLEFNARFGDPECQVLMALWDEDILPWLQGAASGRLPVGRPVGATGAACCVVLASPGYPFAPESGIEIPEPAIDPPGIVVFHAGTERDAGGVLRTRGGRVLGITGIAKEAHIARARAYEAVERWRFEGALVREDIGGTA